MLLKRYRAYKVINYEDNFLTESSKLRKILDLPFLSKKEAEKWLEEYSENNSGTFTILEVWIKVECE